MATAIVIGTVIGSGVFRKAHDVATNIDTFGLVAIAWVLGGVLALLGSLAYAEVAVLYPRAGGNYVFLREGYGRMAGFLWGWVEFWIIRCGSLAALATVFCQSLHDVLRKATGNRTVLAPWQEVALTVAVIVGLALVNVRGVRWGGFLQLFITVVKIGSLLAIVALPLAALAFAAGNPDARLPSTDNLQPIWPTSFTWNLLAGFGGAVYAIQWAYHGWQNIAPAAGEIARPQRNIPLALLGGMAVVIFLYLSANLAYCLVLPQSDLAKTENKVVAAVFAETLLGPVGLLLGSAAIMCSVFGALNGNLLVGPRLLYAMGEDKLVPEALARVHPHYRTPALAILVMASWACVLVVAAALGRGLPFMGNRDVFDLLTDYSMFGATIFETLAVTTIFVFRRRLPNAERPYRCVGYPWVPAVYVVGLALVTVYLFLDKTVVSLVGVGFIAAGGLVYWLFLRPSDPTPAPQELVKVG
jgi:amino acid transporter